MENKKIKFVRFKRRGQVNLLLFFNELRRIYGKRGEKFRAYILKFATNEAQKVAGDLDKMALLDFFAVVLEGCREYVRENKQLKISEKIKKFVEKWENEKIDEEPSATIRDERDTFGGIMSHIFDVFPSFAEEVKKRLKGRRYRAEKVGQMLEVLEGLPPSKKIFHAVKFEFAEVADAVACNLYDQADSLTVDEDPTRGRRERIHQLEFVAEWLEALAEELRGLRFCDV